MNGARGAAFAVAMALMALGPMAGGETAAGARAETLGPVTNLPLPRFVSLKTDKANIRRGPGLTHRVDWVFMRRGMPLEITAEFGHWRRVRDVDDAGGWVHFAMLRGSRSAVVTAPRAALREGPEPGANLVALAEAGVILSVEKCVRNWCEVETKGDSGWIAKPEIWGVGPDEVFD
ncbi:aspartyl-trna synthetase [Pikeienuella piscinae]|uniref:Aspartyl-trna synthetase n=1 Tax=Pikeienuella piscinae TaxID=2748098 RepID=A0A7M3T679_9RHOB|nr:SH3 domain-containing protein [Pikeienuella piscinae]QIE57510.1 aspartyl-trna synthetase [Pikeienuella piscinae]